MKRFTIFVVLSVLPVIVSTAQELNLTLNDAVALALQNNERIKQYEEKFKQKEYSELESWGNFLPKIDFEASYNHLNDDMSIDLNPIRDVIINIQTKNQVEFANIYNVMSAGTQLSADQKLALQSKFMSQLNSLIPSFTETFKKQDFKKATLVGVQPLFLGGKLIAAKNFANAEKEAALADLIKTKNEIVNETIDNYSKVLLLKNVVKTREDVLAGINKHKEDAQKLFDQGIIANYHLLRAEVAVADAERNLITDQNNYELALLALKRTIGIPNDEQISFGDSLSFHNAADSIDVYLNSAKENQPILKIIEEKKNAAGQGYKVVLSSFMPQVAAFGKYEMYPEYLSALEPRWAVGIQLNFNIFNGAKDYTKLQSAIHLENEISFLELDTKKKIDLWINKSFREMQNSKIRFEKLQATESLAQENLRQNEKRFQNGMATSLEVIDAQLSFEKVEIDKYLSLYEYYRSMADLYLAAGSPIDVLKIWSN